MSDWRAVADDGWSGRLEPIPGLRFEQKQVYVIRPDDCPRCNDVGFIPPPTSKEAPIPCPLCSDRNPT